MYVLVTLLRTLDVDTSFQVLSLPPVVAPTKVLIVPLSAKEEFMPLVREVCESAPNVFMTPQRSNDANGLLTIGNSGKVP